MLRMKTEKLIRKRWFSVPIKNQMAIFPDQNKIYKV